MLFSSLGEDRVVVVAAVGLIVLARAGADAVAVGAAVEGLGSLPARDCVVAVAAVEEDDVAERVELVVAGVAVGAGVGAVDGDDVVALAAPRLVAGAGAGLDRVVAGVAVDPVGLGPAEDVVAGAASADEVGAALRLDRVLAQRADDYVRAVRADEPARVTLEVVDGGLDPVALRNAASCAGGRCERRERHEGGERRERRQRTEARYGDARRRTWVPPWESEC